MDDNKLHNQRYEIKEILGKGGFATTYLALDRETQQDCAIKCISFRKIEEWKTWELFEREAQTLKNLNHPQIPAYIDFFLIETDKDVEVYLVQEYVAGKNLAVFVQNGRHFTEREVIEIALELCTILEYLHTLSPPIIHRDIKPSNITLGPENRIHLIDFGAVKDTMISDYSKAGGVPTVVGTYGYMPIEQFEGRAGPASDIYSLGMTLIYLLSHREPGDMEKKNLKLDFQPHVNISNRLIKILDKMIDPDLTKRYQSASDVKADLENVLTEKRSFPWPVLSEVHKTGLVGLLFLGLLLLVSLLLRTRAPLPEPGMATPAPDQPEIVKEETPKLYPVTGSIRYDDQPISDFTTVEPDFFFLNTGTRRHETPDVEYQTGTFNVAGLPLGHYSLNVEINANKENPNRFPGDFIKWGVDFDVPSSTEIIVEMAKVLHLLLPQDNDRRLDRDSSDCSNLTSCQNPVRFVWEYLDKGVKYNYQVGIVDCIKHVYHPGKVYNDWTSETEITLDLPLNQVNQKYSFHVLAEKDSRQIGRLFVHDARGSNWNYDFRVADSESKEPTKPVITGQLLFTGRMITDFTMLEPTFWFRNEDTGKEQYAQTRYRSGLFFIYNLPQGNFGMSVNIDTNTENPWSYPGDFRAWKSFSITERKNPELIVDMQKIIHMTGPQDNNVVMELWGEKCMEKITYTSPVTFRWESLGENVFYDYKITRMDCLNHYNSAGTVTGKTTRDTEVTLRLPPSRDNEVYGFHIHAREEERRIGMLITHGSHGYGWDYRFRVE